MSQQIEKEIDNTREFILNELNKLPHKKNVPTQGAIFIQCPLGVHKDSTPSFSIALAPTNKTSIGGWFCFSCKSKGGWNVLAKKVGLKKIGKNVTSQEVIGLYSNRIQEIKQELLEPEMNEGSVEEYLDNNNMLDVDYEEDFVWREMPYKLLKRIKARRVFDSAHDSEMMVLPVIVHNEVVGLIKARMEAEEGKVSYFNTKGEWVKKAGLFPFDPACRLMKRKKLKVLVLTEGVRDSLRLIMYGIPAMSILGTNNWTDQKGMLLAELELDMIFICMDGDRAGLEATALVKKYMEENSMPHRVINLARLAKKLNLKKLDPGDMPKKYVRILKDKVYKYAKEN